MRTKSFKFLDVVNKLREKRAKDETRDFKYTTIDLECDEKNPFGVDPKRIADIAERMVNGVLKLNGNEHYKAENKPEDELDIKVKEYYLKIAEDEFLSVRIARNDSSGFQSVYFGISDLERMLFVMRNGISGGEILSSNNPQTIYETEEYKKEWYGQNNDAIAFMDDMDYKVNAQTWADCKETITTDFQNFASIEELITQSREGEQHTATDFRVTSRQGEIADVQTVAITRDEQKIPEIKEPTAQGE